MVSPSRLQETVCHLAHKRVQASLHSMRRPLTLVDKRPLLSSLPSHPPKHPSLFFLSITATQTKPHLYNHSHLEQSPSAYANGIYLSSSWGGEWAQKLTRWSTSSFLLYKIQSSPNGKVILKIPIILMIKKLQRPWQFFSIVSLILF